MKDAINLKITQKQKYSISERR